MTSDYRAFGEAMKTILANGQSINLTVSPQTTSVGTLPSKYKQMHLLTLADTVMTVTLANDLLPGTSYNLSTTGQVQVAGVSSISVTSGTVEVLMIA